jgi:hypothetical protein
MLDEKLIIIGCDDGATMPAILAHIRETHLFTPNIISATRASDLITIVRSMNPDLLILCFRNNQNALSDFNIFVRKPEIPILCVTRKFENGMLGQNQKSIIFTYPFEHLNNSAYFCSTINSIFLLRNNSSPPITVNNFEVEESSPNPLTNNPNLGRYALELDQKVEVLLKVKNRISNLYAGVDDPIKAELTSIVNSIKQVSHEHKLWDDFKLYFEQINPHFLAQLTKKFPLLTPIDLKYCCYLLMNMSNDDIKRLLGINQESVRTHKYRLKKKMFLPKEQDLQSFLRSVG